MAKIGKPVAKLIGEDGNVFNLIGICRRALHKYSAAYNEMWERIQKSDSYGKALAIMGEYVEIE
jgi:hypothetical protein